MTETDILLAKIGGPHGIKGEVRVKSFTEDPLGFGDYGKLHDANGKKYQVLKARVQKNMVITRFKSIDTREKAEALNGIELFVARTVLPEIEENDEFYVQDLIGCDVRNLSGEPVGKVIAVPNFGADDMLEIAELGSNGKVSKKTYFLSFTKEIVPEINFEERYIIIVPPIEISERDETEEA